MKLLSITNRYYFISITAFFFIAGIALFYSIRYILNKEMDEKLVSDQIRLSKTMRTMDSLSTVSILLNDNISFAKANPQKYPQVQLFDSNIYDYNENEYESYRIIRFTAETRSQSYLVTIKSSRIENEDIVLSVFLSLMLCFGLFSVILYFANFYFSRKLWYPFIKTVNKIKTININDKEDDFKFEKSNINEFNELNRSLSQMIERIRSDYFRMKDFSENASHELQTPLAIIRSKLECLLQSKDLKENDAQLINQALENTVRLSRINQTLLLLTKIENGQYEQKQQINFRKVFDKYLEFYNSFISEKVLVVSFAKEQDFLCYIHPALADILVSNLLNNAISHNIQKGELSIYMSNNGFEIINSGEKPATPPEQFFTRFKKGTQSSEHLGLGLALVKQIADSNKLRIMYDYFEGKHLIKVCFDCD